MLRRNFIKNSIFLTLFFIIVFLFIKKSKSLKEIIHKLIKTDLTYLIITDSEIDAYLSDFIGQNKSVFTDRQVLILFIGNNWNNFFIKKEYQILKNQIISKFLLSTNFFLNKMNEGIELKYSGVIHGPYSSPCNNPFSSMYYKPISKSEYNINQLLQL